MTRKTNWLLAYVSAILLLALLALLLLAGPSLVSGEAPTGESPGPLGTSVPRSPAASPAEGRWVWQNPLPQGTTLRPVAFLDAQTGWAVGDAGTILHTSNGGTTCTLQSPAVTNTLLSTAFVNAHTGWAVGTSGIILHTTDGGKTWTPQPSGTTGSLWSVFFIDAQTGWAVGPNGKILRYVTGEWPPTPTRVFVPLVLKQASGW